MSSTILYSFFNKRPIKSFDYNDKYVKQYVQVPAYTKDSEGKFINDKPYPVLKRVKDKNLYEYIQSFKDQCDISLIIERLTNANTMPTLEDFIKANTFGDVSTFDRNAPDPVKALQLQIQDLQNEVMKTKQKLAGVENDEVAKRIVDAINKTFGIKKQPKVEDIKQDSGGEE